MDCCVPYSASAIWGNECVKAAIVRRQQRRVIEWSEKKVGDGSTSLVCCCCVDFPLVAVYGKILLTRLLTETLFGWLPILYIPGFSVASRSSR